MFQSDVEKLRKAVYDTRVKCTFYVEYTYDWTANYAKSCSIYISIPGYSNKDVISILNVLETSLAYPFPMKIHTADQENTIIFHTDDSLLKG